MNVERCNYYIPTNTPKNNGEKLSNTDFFNIGYMAGRFGINLDNNPFENNDPKISEKGISLNINCCTTNLFEENLNKAGIKFDIIA